MRAFRRFWNFLSSVFVVIVVALAVALVGVRVIGLTPYAVLSGSMEPTYHVGSLIYVREIEPSEIVPGTPITFVVNEDLLLATHRVVDVAYVDEKEEPVLDESGNPQLDESGSPIMHLVPLEEPAYYYQTKGDANEEVDGSLVHHKNVVGTPVFSVPYLGYLSSWLQTREGMIMGISIALVILILTFLPDILGAVEDEPVRKKRRKKRRSKGKKRPGSGKRKTGAAKTDRVPNSED